jgi:hypothetical protein
MVDGIDQLFNGCRVGTALLVSDRAEVVFIITVVPPRRGMIPVPTFIKYGDDVGFRVGTHKSDAK